MGKRRGEEATEMKEREMKGEIKRGESKQSREAV